jgi:hypothetical protein
MTVTELTKTAFARHLGVTPSRVSQYIARGLPTNWDGTVDTVAGEAWLAKNVRPTRTKARSPTPTPVRIVNKSGVCQHFAWSRHQFDANVAAGMPVVRMATSRGDEWKVDLDAVAGWLDEMEQAKLERARRRRAAAEAQRQENERILARMSEEQRRKLLPRWAR